MKYGESTFDILYLIFAIASGCVMLPKTVCYILLILTFLLSTLKGKKTADYRNPTEKSGLMKKEF